MKFVIIFARSIYYGEDRYEVKKRINADADNYLYITDLNNVFGKYFNPSGQECGAESSKIIIRSAIVSLKEKLLSDLDEFDYALSVYLYDFVEKKILSDKNKDVYKSDYIKNKFSNIDAVLSFNYTHTFKSLYAPNNNQIDYCYIHGEATDNKDHHNIVLGIDEYLYDENKNQQILFVGFKKFYQRIVNQTSRNILQ